MSEHLDDDARWLRLRDAEAVDEFLAPDDRCFLSEYEPRDPSLAAEKRLWLAMTELGRGDDETVERDADDALVAAVLPAFQPSQTTSAPIPLANWRSRAAIVAGMTLALAASVMLWVRVDRSTADNGPAVAAQVSDATEAVVEPLEPLMVASGRILVGERVFETGAVVDGELTTIEPACLRRGTTRVCLGADSRVAVQRERTVVDVLAGAAELIDETDDVTELAAKRGVVELRVAGVRVVATATTRYTVEVFDGGDQWQVRVPEGQSAVVLESSRGVITTVPPGFSFAPTIEPGSDAARGADAREPAEVEAGASSSTGDALEVASRRSRSAARSTVSSRDLAGDLARARSLRAAGEYRDAARVYEQITSAHRRSPLARAALVSLGQLYAGPLKNHRKALAAYDRYLAGGSGPLAEEARYGRIQSLHALGRTSAEMRAIEAFLEAHPASSYAASLRQRLQ